MSARDLYQQWLDSPYIDQQTKVELHAIADQPIDIEDRFYKQLEFGTGGLRGVLGAGTNRINRYTIRRATQGLANFIARFGEEAKQKGVAIAYDSRHQSPELALETACTLAANGIKAYLFEELRPTPELSFAVRELNAQAGIVITASHNPPEYNGYKVYWEDGGQIVPAVANEIIAEIDKLHDFQDVRTVSRGEAESAGLLQWIGKEIDQRYLERLETVCLNLDAVKAIAPSFSIVYTPLHGAGNKLVQQILKKIGFQHVYVVPEQEQPDANFSTVKSPNPEEPAAFELALSLAKDKHAEIMIGTDPDCDRVGLAVLNRQGEYEFLNGNQTGALLLHYLLSERSKRGLIPEGATVIKTIVTSELGRAIAKRYGVDTIDTLTGFKYIGEQIKLFEQVGEKAFLFGYEESYGYLADTFVRDKDGVMSSMLIAEMAAYYKSVGKTLTDVLDELYEAHGYHQEALESRTLKGKDGLERIQSIMLEWRSASPTEIADQPIVEVRDYLQQQATHLPSGAVSAIHLPQENVLYFAFSDGSWFCLRPSGTEPKIKIYFSIKGATKEAASTRLAAVKNEVIERIDAM